MDQMLYMGLNGSVLIMAIMCFRHFFSQQIPKRFMVFLWVCAIARLLLPVSIPVRWPASDRQEAAVSGTWRIDDSGSYAVKVMEKTTKLCSSSDVGSAAGTESDAGSQAAGAETQASDPGAAASAGSQASGTGSGVTAQTSDAGAAAQAAGAEEAMWPELIISALAAEIGAALSAAAAWLGSTVSALAAAGKALEGAAASIWSAALAEHIWLKEALMVVWLAVAVFLAFRIFIMHVRSSRLYNMSLPICDQRADEWLQTHHSIRRVAVRQTEFIKSPLTYGVIRPVILLPSEIELNAEEFACIMEHEWIHIKRWDILVKYILYLTVCIYWFDPLVWVMAVLLNQDMEMACDEEVVKTYSGSLKTAYAYILIRLAEGRQKSLWPVNACFARQSEIEERIRFIMNMKKYSRKAAALAAGMICCTIITFTVSAQEASEKVSRTSDAAEQNLTEATSKEVNGLSENADQQLTDDVSEEVNSMIDHADQQPTDDVSEEVNSMSDHADQQSSDDVERDMNDLDPHTESDGMPAAAAGREISDHADVLDADAANSSAGSAIKEAEKPEQKEGAHASAADTNKQPGAAVGEPAQPDGGREHTHAASTADTAGQMAAAHEEIAKLAGKYAGAPYEYGGTDLYTGVDSAGFIKAIYALAGIEVPADLQKLSACGDIIPVEELAAGDIVIYSSSDESGNLLSLYAHAGIYDGKGRVFHASNKREGVKVSDLHYREIAMAVRIIK